jgi:hypothetical protein
VKFYEFSETVGTVLIDDIEVQYCDHLQKIEGEYYATAFYTGERADGRDENGIFYKKISNANLAFVPLALVEKSKAKIDDYGQTEDMIQRLVKNIRDLNAQEYSRAA